MKFRFNWLIGMIIIMILFISFIIYTAFIHTKISSELISDHYYEEEIEYQEIIDEKKNAVYIKSLNVQVLPLGIKIYSFNGNKFSGTLNLLRLSNKHLDIVRVLQLDTTGKKIIPAYILKNGIYSLRIRWKYSGKRCFVEQTIKWKI